LANTSGGVATLRIIGHLKDKGEVTCLVDSGASQNFMSLELLKEAGIPMGVLDGIDGDSTVRLGDGRQITALGLARNVQLRMGEDVDALDFVILPSSCGDVVLGMPWLAGKNPRVDWKSRKVTIDGKVLPMEPRMEANMMWFELLGPARMSEEQDKARVNFKGKEDRFINDEEWFRRLGVVASDGQIQPGSLVVIRGKNVPSRRWFGPMKIDQAKGPDKFQLLTLDGRRHPQDVHTNRLRCVSPASGKGGIESGAIDARRTELVA
jgi:hypothetical protein